MKRQSKAEEALANQIKNLNYLRREQQALIEACRNKIEVYDETIANFDKEIDRLKARRLTASQARKPGAL